MDVHLYVCSKSEWSFSHILLDKRCQRRDKKLTLAEQRLHQNRFTSDSTRRMAVYTVLNRKTLAGFAEEYSLGKLVKFSGVPAGSVNMHYLLETPKGKFFLKIDEVKKSQDAQRELDLLLFLRTQRFA